MCLMSKIKLGRKLLKDVKMKKKNLQINPSNRKWRGPRMRKGGGGGVVLVAALC